MKISEMLNLGARQLADAGIVNAKGEAEMLYCFQKNIDRAEFFVRWSKEAHDNEIENFFALIEKRASRRPLQHIIGDVEFMGYKFFAEEGVLIPRMDTEVVVQEAFRVMPHKASVLDLCCGSGIIGISLAKLASEEKQVKKITACDKSKKALLLTQKNARENNVKLEVIESDLFEKIKKKYDLIVSNPPYIRTDVIPTLEREVREFEPIEALDGGADGLDFYRKIIKEAPKHLKKRGHLVFEVSFDQGEDVAKIFKDSDVFEDIEISRDLAGDDRVVKARLKS